MAAPSGSSDSAVSPLKLALIQMRIAPGRAEQNLNHAAGLIRSTSGERPDMVLLPEALPFGWMDPTARREAGELTTGSHCRFLKTLAAETGVFLCAGLIERAGDRLFNAAVLIDPNGEVLLHHRKINELEIAHDLYSLGDRLGVTETKFGRIGLMICADAFAPGQVISRSLALMGARIILSPCAWAVPPGHDNSKTPYGGLWMDNYGPVAREHGLWIAGCSNVGPVESGPWAGHHCIGCSMIVGPDGQRAKMAQYGEEAEEVIYFDIPAESPRSR